MNTFTACFQAQDGTVARPARSGPNWAAWVVCSALAACGGGNGPAGTEDVSIAADQEATDAIDAKTLDGSADIQMIYGTEPKFGQAAHEAPAATAEAAPAAAQRGTFGPVFAWPGVPIHQILLPDGRVMTYGTDPTGKVDAKLHFAVWNPDAGVGSGAFTILPNATKTYIFCATQTLVPDTGEVIVVGGTRPDAWGRIGFGDPSITFFNSVTNVLRKDPKSMPKGRYYATVVTSASGEQVILGGRDNVSYPAKPPAPRSTATFIPTPEVYVPGKGLRLLSAAASDDDYGSVSGAWNYPRAWLAPNGRIFGITLRGRLYSLDPAGAGKLTDYSVKTSPSSTNLPGVMFAPGKILSLREKAQVVVVDINGATPVVSATAPLTQVHQYANTTLLPDGKVFLNGGSFAGDVVPGAIYGSQIWDPKTGKWAPGATAAMPRLYHSTSMLLPDGTVLTGGGVTDEAWWLNAEIYSPPYLFKSDGSLASRPQIVAAPTKQLGWNESFSVDVAAGNSISRVTLVRTGAVTHAFNNDQRMNELSFTQAGKTLQLKTPAAANVAPPGYYMLFVFDAAGVPSKARIVRLNA
jgi:Domain of unknown function (DUF1929)